jgi:LPS sulfotransferase NodH
METTAQHRRPLLIAGMGRSGTTLLVKLLTACGFETDPAAEGARERPLPTPKLRDTG